MSHWKAGSTWIEAILGRCAPEMIVPVKYRSAHFTSAEPVEGRIYPRLYLTREEFEQVELPERWSRFVVIRDLRDTLVSGYFSIKYSHRVDHFSAVRKDRERLWGLSLKEGLERLMDRSLVALSAEIQRSWAGSGATLIRYEDLLERDTEILERVLIGECGLKVRPDRLRAAIRASRFAAMSGGRTRGSEDADAHLRRATPGEWREYLHGSLKDSFKSRWGDLLVATGYEQDLDW